MRLTKTQLRILTVLTWELRLAKDVQLALKLGLSASQIRRMLRRLRNVGLLHSWTTSDLSHELAGPLVRFDRGDCRPDFGAVAWQLQSRWLHTRRARAQVIWASEAATKLVGGVGGRIRQPLQVQHDLGVAEIWSRRPDEDGLKWISEDIFRRWYVRDARTKVPDALLINESGQTVKCAIEYGGQYSRRRLEAFHRYWSTRCPYEIW